MRRLLIVALFAGLAFASLCLPVSAAGPMSKAEKAKLFMLGARLWPVYCNECHNARPPGEKTRYEWDQEMIHMQTLSNMPAEDARAILEFLTLSH